MTFYHFRVLTLLLIRVLFSRPFFEFFNTSNQYSNLFTVSNLTYKKLLLQINLEQQHGGKYYTNRQVNGGEHIMNYSGTSPYRHLHNTDTFPLRTVHLVPETENSMQSLYPCNTDIPIMRTLSSGTLVSRIHVRSQGTSQPHHYDARVCRMRDGL